MGMVATKWKEFPPLKKGDRRDDIYIFIDARTKYKIPGRSTLHPAAALLSIHYY